MGKLKQEWSSTFQGYETEEDIRGYIFNMPSLVDAEKTKRAIDLMMEKEK